MIGVLIATHFNIGKVMLETAASVIGRQMFVEAIGISGDMDPCCFGDEIMETIQRMKKEGCGEVLLLLDLYGGTPCNEAVKLLRDNQLQILTGVNLPMLLEILTADRQAVTAPELLAIGETGGRKGIVNVTGQIAGFGKQIPQKGE